MSFKMDMTKMKKVAEDEHSATMKHPQGHEMKIAKKALSAEMRKQLEGLTLHGKPEKMAHGGMPADQGTQDETSQDENSQGQPVINVNVGGQPVDAGSQPVEQDPSPSRQPASLLSDAGNWLMGKPTGEEQKQIDTGKEEKAADDVKKWVPPITAKETPAPTLAQAAPAPAPAPEQEAPQPEPVAPPAVVAPKHQPKAVKPAIPANPQQVKAGFNQELSQEDAAVQHDLHTGQITPENYSDLFAKKDTLGKVSTLFGLMISGFGAGLTHQPNAVLEMMNKEIDRDTQAQMTNQSNAKDVYKLGLEKKLQEAQISGMDINNKFTQAQTEALHFATYQAAKLQSTYHNLVITTNKMPEGQAKEAAKLQLGAAWNGVKDRINDINDQASGAAAFYNTLYNQSQGQGGAQQPSDEQAFQKQTNGMRMMGPQGEVRAKDLEEKHVPGLKGQASAPLSGAEKDAINSGIEYDQQLHRFMDWTKKHSGDLSPTDMKTGAAMAKLLSNAYRGATDGGVYKSGEQTFINQIIDPDPTKFLNNIRVMPSLDVLANESKAHLNQFLKSKGTLSYEPSAAKTQEHGPKEGQTATNKKTGQTLTFRNGKWE